MIWAVIGVAAFNGVLYWLAAAAHKEAAKIMAAAIIDSKHEDWRMSVTKQLASINATLDRK